MKRFAILAAATLLAGCINTATAPVDYGPQSDPQQILNTINGAVSAYTTDDIKVGQYVEMMTTQDVALGEQVSTVGATGKTVTNRTEDNDKIVWTGDYQQLQLNSDGTYSKIQADGDLFCQSKTDCACGECESSSSDPSKAETTKGVTDYPIVAPLSRSTLVSKAQLHPTSTSVANLKFTAPANLIRAAATAAAQSETFHHFKTWKTVDAPPSTVAARPNCLGIPNCAINVTHISFDEVFWDTDPRGTKVHIEASYSPDVPYLARNLSTCNSYLVNVGTDGSNVLLKQCSDVYDFLFQAQ